MHLTYAGVERQSPVAGGPSVGPREPGAAEGGRCGRQDDRALERGRYLHPELLRVYAVGHRAPSVEADVTAAVLYAGPGAMLSHAAALATEATS